MATRKKNSDKEVLKRLANFGKDVAAQIKRKRDPAVTIPTRSLSNVRFNKSKSIIELGNQKQTRNFFNVNMAKKFMQTMLVAAGCKEFVESG